jgi:hypothetical protein
MGFAVLVLGSTRIGRVAGDKSEHFLLYYAGVLVLIALTATVVIGLVSTDRIVMSPGSRVTAQAVHRAASVGAMALLGIHIATEVAAGKSRAVDVVLPFLDHWRTFYLGLGTVASDLMVMVAVTGIFRARLAHSMSPLKWRVLHGSAYAGWLIAIVHGLSAGRASKSFFGFSGFVPWSYAACVAAVAVALVVRFVATDRTAGQMEGQPVPERPAPPWIPAAGVPALGQAGFGASHLAVTAARPPQRALPARSSTPTTVGLPVGRGEVGDGGEFGRDDTGGHFGRDDTRVRFGEDEAHGGSGRDDARRYFGQDDAPGRCGRDDPRGGFGRDDARRYFGQDDARGRRGRDDPRGGFDEDDGRGRYGRDDGRGRYGGDDGRGRYGRDDELGRYGQDDGRGCFDQDDASALDGNFSDHEETGPLPSEPYSRYGTRS